MLMMWLRSWGINGVLVYLFSVLSSLLSSLLCSLLCGCAPTCAGVLLLSATIQKEAVISRAATQNLAE